MEGASTRRGKVARGAVVLALAAMLGGAFAVVPAVGEVVAKAKKAKFAKNAGKLDGLDSSAFLGSQALAAFVHTSSASNIESDCTFLDHPSLNGNPAAILSAVHVDNGSGNLDREIGLFYDSAPGAQFANRWCILVQDGGGMPNGMSFHVIAFDPPG